MRAEDEEKPLLVVVMACSSRRIGCRRGQNGLLSLFRSRYLGPFETCMNGYLGLFETCVTVFVQVWVSLLMFWVC